MSESEQNPRILVTGASGLLGRAILRVFQDRFGKSNVIGLAFSRAQDLGLVKCDLRDSIAVEAIIREYHPDIVIHSAAERKPDACESDPEGSALLNVTAVFALAAASAKAKAAFVYISTDYLFDGTAAPYNEDAKTCPLNEYGRLKLRGEHAALAAHPRPFILRVPVLFGPCSDVTESAVTTFAKAAKDSQKLQKIDDWQIRVPTYTLDIAETLVLISRALFLKEGSPSGIFNYSSNVRVTRWALVQLFGKILSCDISHITKLDGPPPGAPRPYDCQLLTTKLEKLGLAAHHTPFEIALKASLDGLLL
jgi:nucleoside-diphosphate-sugar epimerase